MAQHTKGPWTVSQPCAGFSEIRGGDDQLIFGLAAGSAGEKRGEDECEANARLIAAAPDLLSIAKRWAALDGGSWHVERHAREKAELLAETCAAISKAESQS